MRKHWTWEKVKAELDVAIDEGRGHLRRFELRGDPAGLALRHLPGVIDVAWTDPAWVQMGHAGKGYRGYRGAAVLCDPTRPTKLVVVRGHA